MKTHRFICCSFASLRLCVRFFCFILILEVLTGNAASAADNQLTPQETKDGWKLLFNGKDLDGWKNSNGRPVKAKVEDGAFNPHGSGGYLLVYDKPFGDFVLKCDVKMADTCNSGIFFRVGDLKDPVQSGFEVQISSDTKPDLHGFGAIYDLAAPTQDVTHGPGKWNTVEIRCEGPLITVTVNGKKVNSINCDEWDEPGQRLDGSGHKFKKAIKDFPRKGYLGFQDHGHDAWYKNVRLKEL